MAGRFLTFPAGKIVRRNAKDAPQIVNITGRGEGKAVQDLKGQFAFATAVADLPFAMGYNCSITRMVSSMAAAASTPLLPPLEPARSMACSMVSQVSRPKPMGTPECIMA